MCITTQKLMPGGPYWWTTPDLQDNDDPNGAIVFHWEPAPTILWVRPGLELPEMFKMHRGYNGELLTIST